MSHAKTHRTNGWIESSQGLRKLRFSLESRDQPMDANVIASPCQADRWAPVVVAKSCEQAAKLGRRPPPAEAARSRVRSCDPSGDAIGIDPLILPGTSALGRVLADVSSVRFCLSSFPVEFLAWGHVVLSAAARHFLAFSSAEIAGTLVRSIARSYQWTRGH